MFQSHPAVQAARTVLSGQLLSGGISLLKDGNVVQITPTFKDHLNEVWIPFAQDVIDCYLKWGYVAISYEEEENPLVKTKRQKVKSEAKKSSKAKCESKVNL